jgi:hypothetical protein
MSTFRPDFGGAETLASRRPPGENPLRRENLSHGSGVLKVTVFYRLLPSSGRIHVADLPYFAAVPAGGAIGNRTELRRGIANFSKKRYISIIYVA